MKQRGRSVLILFICIISVMAAAVIVRLPSSALPNVSEENRNSYINENGLPYLIDPDSYYHVRLTDNYLNYGTLGDGVDENGMEWDTKSFYPEGRSAEYQPGIIVLTSFVWRILNPVFGTELYMVEFWIAACMSAVAALAAFILGKRLGGTAAGFVSGILVACASSYVSRTTAGRFDTDMFLVLMDVLLILFLTESFRAKTVIRRILFSLLFALVVLTYSLCWSAYSFVFSLLTLTGGLIFLIILIISLSFGKEKKSDTRFFLRQPEFISFILCIGFSVLMLLPVYGSSFFDNFSQAFTTAQDITASNVMPNLFISISELKVNSFFPSNALQWFMSYTPGAKTTVLNGIGVIISAGLCVCGVIVLIFKSIKKNVNGSAVAMGRRPSVLYLAVLAVWLAGGLYAVRMGTRFTEHLAVPVGILAGAAVGWFLNKSFEIRPASEGIKVLLSAVLCAAVVLLPVWGSVRMSMSLVPDVTDSSAGAMDWIKENSESPDAVIASWWDLGYYYEAESGHPAFWDGGSQDPVRAILIGKALTTDNLSLSQGIFKMLSVSGNKAAEYLMEIIGPQRGVEAVLSAIPLDKDSAVLLFEDNYGLTETEAAEAERLVHPAEQSEIYLIVTDKMMRQIAWIEYYGGWDFSGEQAPPTYTTYNSTPDGRLMNETEDEEVQRFFDKRKTETLWRLFFDRNGGNCFEIVYQQNDGIRNVQVWRVVYGS